MHKPLKLGPFSSPTSSGLGTRLSLNIQTKQSYIHVVKKLALQLANCCYLCGFNYTSNVDHYRIAGNIGEELNLVDWLLVSMSSSLKSANYYYYAMEQDKT